MKQAIIRKLRSGGERITPIRTALIEILAQAHSPVSQQELLYKLQKKGFSANKTTIYRQLEALCNFGVVLRVQFLDRSKRYELVHSSGHHHHLVCLECQRVEDVAFPADLEEQEKLISKKYGFKILNHSLEFYGLCRRCRNK